MPWVDATSYSRDERGRVEPRSWELECTPRLSVVVTRVHGCDGWHLTCHAIGVVRYDMGLDDLEFAKDRAVRLVAARLSDWSAALERASREESRDE
jgi:hypothetical protein